MLLYIYIYIPAYIYVEIHFRIIPFSENGRSFGGCARHFLVTCGCIFIKDAGIFQNHDSGHKTVTLELVCIYVLYIHIRVYYIYIQIGDYRCVGVPQKK